MSHFFTNEQYRRLRDAYLVSESYGYQEFLRAEWLKLKLIEAWMIQLEGSCGWFGAKTVFGYIYLAPYSEPIWRCSHAHLSEQAAEGCALTTLDSIRKWMEAVL